MNPKMKITVMTLALAPLLAFSSAHADSKNKYYGSGSYMNSTGGSNVCRDNGFGIALRRARNDAREKCERDGNDRCIEVETVLDHRYNRINADFGCRATSTFEGYKTSGLPKDQTCEVAFKMDLYDDSFDFGGNTPKIPTGSKVHVVEELVHYGVKFVKVEILFAPEAPELVGRNGFIFQVATDNCTDASKRDTRSPEITSQEVKHLAPSVSSPTEISGAGGLMSGSAAR